MYQVIILNKDNSGNILNINITNFEDIFDVENAIKKISKPSYNNLIENNIEIWLYDNSDCKSEKLLEMWNKGNNGFSRLGNNNLIAFNKEWFKKKDIAINE